MSNELKFPVETSAHHVHLTQENIEILFGAGHQLTPKKDLSQPGQFAAAERVTVVGPRNQIERVSILGPARNVNQVEISLTEARMIGVDAPVRESGDVKGSAPCTIKGPVGEITLDEGVIAAKRHIHFTNADAERFGIKDKDIVSVKLETNGRSLIFGDVICRVRDDYALAMHIDTDESNAASAPGDCIGEIVK